jgi:glucosamine--fructose-6-phosphate aminotransferase (isomerizing)
MCGIFGAVSDLSLDVSKVKAVASHSQQRGKDSSGLMWLGKDNGYRVIRADKEIGKIFGSLPRNETSLVVGHSRLITNGMSDNQPVIRDGVAVFHNGIVVNHESIWSKVDLKPELETDTEIIAVLAGRHASQFGTLAGASDIILTLCEGSISCVVVHPENGEIALFSNTGSLFIGESKGITYFASEKFPLEEIGCIGPEQIYTEKILKTKKGAITSLENITKERPELVTPFNFVKRESDLLEYKFPTLKRCSRCILPDTMPFIKFDSSGVCNYCLNYKLQNTPKPASQLSELLERYRRPSGPEALMPFSGGRDSSYALHLVATEFNIRTIAYTYDWGMVTDLGRRNISRMCAKLGVENIVVAADIGVKRRNIQKNLTAWLSNPHLGMISILTAGDKHFFKYVKTVKKQTGVDLNLWGVNPLETTHFKAGFLGMPPDFEMEGVYSSGLSKQLAYQKKRFTEMLKTPKYLNSSLWDTVSGEYYRSVAKKSDYFHIFDYWHWDENEINSVLIDEYNWEISEDTSTTWRIGDGTAAFYNYVYFTVAGFSEHETFRSNQIREGEMSRGEALRLVGSENTPRYENIKWYLDSVGIDFTEAITKVNSIPKLY